MKINELMSTPAYSVDARAELDVAMALMDEHNVRHLPVLDNGEVVGVVSDRDLLEATGWIRADRRRVQLEASGEGPARTIAAVMHSPAKTVAPDETIFTAAVSFVTQRIGCLPVVEDGKLVGILTELDLLCAYTKACADKTRSCEDPHVAAPMTSPPLTVAWDCGLDEATELCQTAGVRHLPVCENERLVGMISDRDLRRARGRGRAKETMMEEIMTKGVTSISPEERLHEAARLMYEERIGALPVIADGILIGIVSSTDLVYHCMQHLQEPEPST